MISYIDINISHLYEITKAWISLENFGKFWNVWMLADDFKKDWKFLNASGWF